MGVVALMYLGLAASKAFSSPNITAHTVSSVSRSSAVMVEIFRPSQKRDLRGVVAVLVSEVIF